eukprot:CAMPEP_0113645540 /NCGR_PEP_ID=MMETSP0017_2-20120614/24011_1 /TAXON_ID=2856 /ORGANISM="Cylindrotheca closterium" /LENGTH=528 /DNA_ID=CAMNT_0000557295 /DNA_START=1634 /DNA_END=3220 /DNA_ORIENTATION=- /assembly_acc=CAM_ASM_000147
MDAPSTKMVCTRRHALSGVLSTVLNAREKGGSFDATSKKEFRHTFFWFGVASKRNTNTFAIMPNTIEFAKEEQDVDKKAEHAIIKAKIRKIPNDKFMGSRLTNVDFSSAKNLKRILGNAFKGSPFLEHVVFPKSLKEIESYAFSGCTNMVLLIMNEGLEKIGKGAFHECYGLENVCSSSTVENIGPEAFASCRELGIVALNHMLGKIGGGVFKDCPKLKKIGLSSNTIVASNSFPKRVEVTEPEDVFDEVFLLIQEKAKELGVTLPNHAPRLEVVSSRKKCASKKCAAIPEGGDFMKYLQGIVEENNQLKVAAAVAEVDEMKFKLQEKNSQVDKLGKELETTKWEFDESQRYLGEAKECLKRTREEVKEKSKKAKYHHSCRMSLAAELDVSTWELRDGETRLEDLRKENDMLNAKCTLIKKKAETRLECLRKENEMITAGKTLIKKKAEEERKRLWHAKSTVEAKLEETKKSLEKTRTEQDQFKATIDDMEKSLEKTEKERDQYKATIDGILHDVKVNSKGASCSDAS